MNFWEAYEHLKSGKYLTRRKKDPSIIYDRRDILYYDPNIGILSLDSRVKNISHIELDAEDWEIISKEYLSKYHQFLSDKDGDMFENG